MKTSRREQTGRSEQADDWIFGVNPVFEAIRAGREIKNIFVSSVRHEKVPAIRKEAAVRNIPVTIVEPAFLDVRFRKGHQGIAASAARKGSVPLDELLRIPEKRSELPFFLILDCIEDTGNFGALLRVADAAGIHGIVIQSRRSAGLSADAAKASAGAIEHMPVSVVANVKHAIRVMKEKSLWVIGADAGARDILWNADLSMPVALVVGSEGKGLRRTVSGMCDMLIRIPMFGKINSLNVSVAASVCAFEILRQRTQKSKKILDNHL